MEDRIRSELWEVVLPLRPPVGTPLGPLREISALVVRLADQSGAQGCGYALTFDAASLQQFAHAAKRVLEAQAPELARLVWIERLVSDGGDLALRKAVAAISLAAWDLAGRRRGKACADLWGRQRAALPVYASALFLDRSPDELVQEARSHRAAGFALVKMRGGSRTPAEDAARFAAVRSVYPEPHSVAIDFVCQSDVARTREFARAIHAEPMWLEDPVPYDALGQLDAPMRIAAGESCNSAQELLALRAAGVSRLILDVEYLGGPLRFLEAARMLQALGCEVGSHLFAHESLHLLAALPHSMPVEVLEWGGALFDEFPRPEAGGSVPVKGPGFGRTLREDTLERYGRKL